VDDERRQPKVDYDRSLMRVDDLWKAGRNLLDDEEQGLEVFGFLVDIVEHTCWYLALLPQVEQCLVDH
jgi:hypothetical protein